MELLRLGLLISGDEKTMKNRNTVPPSTCVMLDKGPGLLNAKLAPPPIRGEGVRRRWKGAEIFWSLVYFVLLALITIMGMAL